MAMSESCAACGCQIANNRTVDGPAVRHGAKLYCAECAAMILPPEELQRLSNPAAAGKTAAPAAGIMADDNILGDMPATEPAAASVPSPSGSRVQRAVTALPKRDSVTTVAKRKSSTRSANLPPPPPTQTAPQSRRSGTATLPRRDSSAGGARPDRDTSSGRDGARKGKRKQDSTGLYIGLGVGAVALAVGGYFAFSGKPPKSVAKVKPKEEFVDNDKTPSDVYAQKGKDFLDKNDRMNAVEMYRKAAGRAEKEGNVPQAQKYNMQIDSIIKASTLR
jgi:hypothetical protein